MKRILTFVLGIVLILGAIPNVSAETSIRLDDEKIHLLEEYATRIPYFEGDEVYSADFARKVILFLFGCCGYKSYDNIADTCYIGNGGIYSVFPEADVNKEYQLIFNKAVPTNTKIDGTYINYEAKCEYAPECNNSEYSDKYIVASGNFGDDWYIYQNATDDGNGGLYVTIRITLGDGEFVKNDILHIVPCDNENGFALVSHTPYMPNSGISVEINGQKLESDQEPVMVNDRVLVPMRAIFEAFNTTVSYEKINNSMRIITAINNEIELQLSCEETSYYNHWDIGYVMKGNEFYTQTVDFDVAPIIINGRTMVPVRVIAETLGADVSWNGDTKTVIISGAIPSKWSRADDIEKMDGLSYYDLLDIVKGYCDKNNITIEKSVGIWDFEHGKGVAVTYGYNRVLKYYYDGYIKNM